MRYTREYARGLSLTFSAGALGGLINGITVWLFGLLGITNLLSVKIAPKLTPAWLYPRLVWGGLWGFLFLLPVVKEKSYILRGVIYSIAPTLVQLFVVFPVKAKKGMLGLQLGTLTFLFVILFNAAWGIVAAAWLEWGEQKE